ncbi:AAA family ATPase [Natronocalculus amylovorans]|uniref:SMC family ATPase n=1 Tax=Natronocalculus amylovorans TaxID=2917812 RepID=A0AAE3FZK5_9EURY|nr:SMC family ATPase [Natronocalculus amylovorans]MCL9818229.1 SMC family ATPase [Natronocalculus amylovorans]
MKITEVTLTNVKSYSDRTTVPLRGGVTAILGENGSGKSTIQEAIGFALFDSLPFNNKELIREGAKSGLVEVTFTKQSRDKQQIFRVKRGVGRSTYDVYRYDEAADEWIDLDIGSKSDLIDWLTSQFSVADGDELSRLWESCIGVPQTSFLSDFGSSFRIRKETFDPLLGVDAYEESWENALKDAPDTIKADKNNLRDEIQTLTGEVQSLPDERRRAEDLQAKITSLKDAIDSLSDEITKLEAKRDELESQQGRIEELETQINSKQQEIDAKEAALETAEAELESAEEAVSVCEQAEKGYLAHESAREKRDTLQDKEAELNDLKDQKSQKDQEVARAEAAVEQCQKDVVRLEQAEKTLSETASEKERYDELETQISALKQRAELTETLEQEVSELSEKIKETKTNIEQRESTIESIQRKEEAIRPTSEIREELSSAKANKKALESEEKKLKTQIDRLRDADADAPCPTCDRPLDETHRSETIATKESRLEEISERYVELEASIEALESEHTEAQEIEQEVASLPNHNEMLESLQDNLSETTNKKEEAESELQEAKEKAAELPERVSEKESLQDVYDNHITAKARVNEFSGAHADLEDAKSRLEEHVEAQSSIEEQISEYDHVEPELKAVKETLSETQEDYNKYIQHKKQAAELDDRKAAVESLQSTIESVTDAKSGLQTDLETEQESFDKETLENLTAEVAEKERAKAAKEGSKRTTQDTLTEVKETTAELESKLDSRSEKLTEYKELEADLQFANWVRENVRAAGPKMREVITDRIGQRANQIFRSIRGRSSETLEWRSDYEIIVHDARLQKSFTTLSGGEKMAAALSVRLATLEQLSTIGIAFLDEPTANLDAEKRANLVEQLNTLDAFTQLTVISHDETFDSMTDYTVTVEKDKQTTEVVSQ